MLELDVYYDYRSPPSYFADRVLELNSLGDARWIPISLVHLSDYADRPMGFNNRKRASYTQQDLARSAEQLGLHFAIPEYVAAMASRREATVYGRDHPIDSHLALCGACLADERGKLRDYNRAVFESLWVKGEDLSRPEVIAAIARSIGQEPEEFLESASGKRVEDILLENTRRADELGVFEVPTYFVGGRMICGYDRIERIRYELDREKVL